MITDKTSVLLKLESDNETLFSDQTDDGLYDDTHLDRIKQANISNDFVYPDLPDISCFNYNIQWSRGIGKQTENT